MNEDETNDETERHIHTYEHGHGNKSSRRPDSSAAGKNEINTSTLLVIKYFLLAVTCLANWIDTSY